MISISVRDGKLIECRIRLAYTIPSGSGEGAGTTDRSKGGLDRLRAGSTNGIIDAPVDNNLTEDMQNEPLCYFPTYIVQ